VSDRDQGAPIGRRATTRFPAFRSAPAPVGPAPGRAALARFKAALRALSSKPEPDGRAGGTAGGGRRGDEGWSVDGVLPRRGVPAFPGPCPAPTRVGLNAIGVTATSAPACCFRPAHRPAARHTTRAPWGREKQRPRARRGGAAPQAGGWGRYRWAKPHQRSGPAGFRLRGGTGRGDPAASGPTGGGAQGGRPHRRSSGRSPRGSIAGRPASPLVSDSSTGSVLRPGAGR